MQITPEGREAVRSQYFLGMLKGVSHGIKERGHDDSMTLTIMIAWTLTGHSYIVLPTAAEEEELLLWLAKADSMVAMVDCGWSGHEIAKFFETDSESVMTTVREISKMEQRLLRGTAKTYTQF